jgi:transcriptional regulator with XRE-family HTH domain
VIDLAALRRTVGVTQVELAASLGTSQGQVSRMERQQDMLISTLASYLQAFGVRASLVVEVGEQAVTYDLTAERGNDDYSG